MLQRSLRELGWKVLHNSKWMTTVEQNASRIPKVASTTERCMSTSLPHEASSQMRGATRTQRQQGEAARFTVGGALPRRTYLQSLPFLQHAMQAQPAATQPEAAALHIRPAASPTSPSEPLSMKAAVTFETCWNRLTTRLKDYVCPREIVWLNGAPGSGKGTNIPFIMRTRGISRAVTMSQLLDGSPDIKGMIDKGELVPDTMVLDALLDAILNPDRNDGNGLVIDGFPRTAMQVDFVKLLFDKLMELHLKHADSPDEFRFPRPSFKVVILYVDEFESVRRQLNRAKLAKLHNHRVMEAGTGEMWDVRTTDVSDALCKRRYQVFKAHYHTILRLKNFFAFSLIDAMGTMEECRSQIMRELRYQSSLDLDEKTYQAIRHLPLARDLVRVARQRLVFRLDTYSKRQPKMFADVIKLIDSELLPVLKQCSLAGHAEFKTRHPVLLGNATAIDMLIDVLSDRGFSVAHSEEDRLVPVKIDLQTGAIENKEEVVHKLRITFDKENVRDLTTPVSITTKSGEEVAIGTTVVPAHMRRESKSRLAMDPGCAPEIVDDEESDGSLEMAVPGIKKSSSSTGSSSGSTSSKGLSPSLSPRFPFTETGQNLASEKAAPAVGSRNNHVSASNSRSSTNLTSIGDNDSGLDEESGMTEEEVQFLSGFDSMDHELNAAGRDRHYGYDVMNDRED